MDYGNGSTIDLSNIFPNLPTNAAVNINQFEFTNNGWYTSDDQGHSTKITINYSNNQTLSIYVADYPSKQKLYGKLKMLKKALNQYKNTYGTYPPSNHLNYLVDVNILNKLPNNPYTSNDDNTDIPQNITDWKYVNSNSNITLSPYSHPSISISFSN